MKVLVIGDAEVGRSAIHAMIKEELPHVVVVDSPFANPSIPVVSRPPLSFILEPKMSGRENRRERRKRLRR